MDELVTVWEMELMGFKLRYRSLKELTDGLNDDLEGLSVGQSEELIIRVVEMQECDLDALPEFEGW